MMITPLLTPEDRVRSALEPLAPFERELLLRKLVRELYAVRTQPQRTHAERVLAVLAPGEIVSPRDLLPRLPHMAKFQINQTLAKLNQKGLIQRVRRNQYINREAPKPTSP